MFWFHANIEVSNLGGQFKEDETAHNKVCGLSCEYIQE